MINKSALLVAALLLLSTTSSYAQTTNMTVVSVGDGDSIRIRNVQGQVFNIRLACIDAPEPKQQPWGEKATARLKQLLPVGQTVKVVGKEQDKYKRLVADIFVGQENINLRMVKEGYAVVYRQYLYNCPEYENSIVSAEKTARQNRLAFWSQSSPVMPWDFRRTPVAVKPQPQQGQRQGCDRSYPDVCIPPAPPDLDCGDIPYRRFRVVGDDPHRFDRDRDGIGCER